MGTLPQSLTSCVLTRVCQQWLEDTSAGISGTTPQAGRTSCGEDTVPSFLACLPQHDSSARGAGSQGQAGGSNTGTLVYFTRRNAQGHTGEALQQRPRKPHTAVPVGRGPVRGPGPRPHVGRARGRPGRACRGAAPR